MKKPTPNPPETPDISPYESLESKKFHEAAERALDHHFKPPTEPHPRRETGLFKLSPAPTPKPSWPTPPKTSCPSASSPATSPTTSTAHAAQLHWP